MIAIFIINLSISVQSSPDSNKATIRIVSHFILLIKAVWKIWKKSMVTAHAFQLCCT